MKSKTIIYIKAFKIIWLLDFIYYLIYNTYFGWNKTPINDIEKMCDDVFKFILGFGLGMLLIGVFEFIELVVNFIKHNSK